ncbi:TetR family transcriptional regulator [Natribacillus halophilus]|uniref:DNA-binding transcriptional regulator, AcrR family n=1 Tax=Natribacillus halophilus TaxID=549003 RepID=A0A1G8QML8_9BACI|nr:TetR family transcriptional regulator [Natribacillus halophilus]SDJ06024.1 DNA-binding transcriptional regulator, AcrR family [Natribacillus halophilus]
MDKKEKIVHAAIDVFREKGVEKTKVSDIVQIAGIAQGTFYLYFPSKLSVMPNIAEVMVGKMMEDINHHVQEGSPFQVQLEQIIDVVYNLTKEYPDVFALIYAGLTQTEHLKEWEAIYAPFYKWMSEFLSLAKDSEIIRDSLHTERTAKMIIGLIESTAEQVYLYDNKQEKETIRLQKQELVSFISYALGVKR